MAALAGGPTGLAVAATSRDRNHDRIPDSWERRYHLSTRVSAAKGDPDHDKLNNLGEYRNKTNPRKADTDRDGLSDGAEVKRYHTDPRKSDTDRDGLSDGAEILDKTNPLAADT